MSRLLVFVCSRLNRRLNRLCKTAHSRNGTRRRPLMSTLLPCCAAWRSRLGISSLRPLIFCSISSVLLFCAFCTFVRCAARVDHGLPQHLTQFRFGRLCLHCGALYELPIARSLSGFEAQVCAKLLKHHDDAKLAVGRTKIRTPRSLNWDTSLRFRTASAGQIGWC
jgi:hypothetical protein